MMKMKNFKLPACSRGAVLAISLLVMLTIKVHLQAQFLSCGTIIPQEQVDLEASFVPSDNPFIEKTKTLSVIVHVVNDKSGEPGITENAINSAFVNLNNAYADAFLQFNVCELKYIDNYQYNSLRKVNEAALITKYLEPHMINIFLVGALFDVADNPTCGYTYYPVDEKNYIILAKDCFNPIDLTHQMGHLFGLYHTHEIAFASEIPTGSNCTTAGDLICDTPADPVLAGKVNDQCEYTVNTKMNEAFYVPEVTNYMSFSRTSCMCTFSPEQLKRMQAVFFQYKNGLW